MWTVSFHLLLFWRNRKQGHLLSEEQEGEGGLRREREKRACSGPVGAWGSEWSREVGLG